MRNVDESSELLIQSYNLGKPLVGPGRASVPITTLCNSKCVYCPPGRVVKGNGPSIETLKKLFHQMFSMGVRQISLTGGEPLLRQDLGQIVIAAKNTGLDILILTNGTLLTEQRGQSLINAGVSGFIVSMDTLDSKSYMDLRGIPIHDALRGIDSLQKIKYENPEVTTCVTSVITRHNIANVASLANYLFDKRIHYQIQPVLESIEVEICSNDHHALMELRQTINRVNSLFQTRYSDEEKEYTAYIPEYIRRKCLPVGFRCMAMYSLIHLDANLNLYPCWRLPAVGSLMTDSLHDIWLGSAMQSERHQLKTYGCPGCWLLCDAKPSLKYQDRKKNHEN
jgi:radical SAM protein with 4Fe4S-binding SPASM domain